MMKKILLSGIIICLLYSPAMAASTAGIVEKGNRSYSLKNYGKALEFYDQALAQSPDSALINFNAGAARYKTRDYKQANAFFEKSLATDDKDLEAKANYNLGNSKYMLGLSMENSELNGAVQLLEGALNNYKRTTEITPADEDVKANYKIVEKKLKELKEKLKKQPQQQNKGGQKQKQENKEQSGQQGQENKEDQQQDKQQNKQGQQGREENSSGQEKQEEEKQQQQGSSEQERRDGARRQEQNERSQEGKEQGQAQYGEPEEMSKQEANMLLEGYRREEMPAGMLNDKRQGKEANVSKDW